MLSPLDQTSSPPTEAVLHQYRIRSKRARYAAEFASPSPESEKFIAGLKVLQDALGDWHDWLTLRQTAIEDIGEVRESPLVAELHNVTGAKFRHAVAVLTRSRGKLEASSELTARLPTPAAQKPALDAASAA